MIKKTFYTVIALMFVAGIAAAQTTGTLLLRGTVPAILEVTVTPEPAANSLDLSIDVTDLHVATVNERSNNLGGYTITLSSANAAAEGTSDGVFLSADVDNDDALQYSITYDGDAVVFGGGSAIVADVNGRTSALGNSRDVRISYTGSAEFMYADEYEDTLTFTIAAK
ncbi:MAG: hypothetical protein EA426_07320 [Spirochaetaceae bacterium]|nr:MAG: hypothetical protein EA426_07320 [Spirochaetaceae bacterium]